MSINVKEIFQAESQTVLWTLSRPGIGYQVPSYQRSYSWKNSNIYRLIEDIVYGVKELKADEHTLSFLGTFIVTPLQATSTMPAGALSIVDGQQRLTTIVLLIAILHEDIRYKTILIKESNSFHLNREVRDTLQNLKKCLFHDFKMSDDAFDFQPVITRDVDTWANDKYECKYNSAVSLLLHNYAKHLFDDSDEKFDFVLMNTGVEFKELNSRLEYISLLLDQVYSNDDEGLFVGNVEDLKNNTNVLNELIKFKEDFLALSINTDLVGKSDTSTFIAIILSKYLLNKVVLTRVLASEKYAFDVFESLNTTGEPLTALETFKPKLINVINSISNSTKAYHQSKSKISIEFVEAYIQKHGEINKLVETQDLINNFALLYSGAVLGNNLSVQRKYLRENISLISNEDAVNEFLSRLEEIVHFKYDVWDSLNFESKLNRCKDKKIILVCCQFLISCNKTLTIPVLTRYYTKAFIENDYTEFGEVIKALTAFTLIWRTAFGGTRGIDSVYKELMSIGFKKKRKGSFTEIFNPLSYINKSAPSALDFSDILQQHLKSKSLSSFDSWFKYARDVDIYNASGPIAKMFLLVACNKTSYDIQNGKLIKNARGNVNEFLTLDVWNSPRSYSIEHIAPQNTNKNSTWEKLIYDEVNTVNTIGNLTLLPLRENSTVANSNWECKKVYFTCFTQKNSKNLGLAIENANKLGFSLPKKVVNELSSSDYLDFLKPIITQSTWTKEDINMRTHNLCELLWSELSDWLLINRD